MALRRLFGGDAEAAALSRFWPEVGVASCWLVLFLASSFVFRDDESLGHRATHLGLWLSLGCYIAFTLRELRSSES